MTRLGIVFVIIELHHLREVDIAPFSIEMFSSATSVGVLGTCFFWFLYLIELKSQQFFPKAVGRSDCKRCVTCCVWIRGEAQNLRKEDIY